MSGFFLSRVLTSDAIRMPGPTDRGVITDEALAIEIVQAIIHQSHSFLAPGLQDVLQVMNLVFADEIADGSGGDKQLVCEDAPGAIRRWQKFLRDDSLQCVRELQHDLSLGAAFEYADDPFERVRDIR